MVDEGGHPHLLVYALLFPFNSTIPINIRRRAKNFDHTFLSIRPDGDNVMFESQKIQILTYFCFP